MDDFAGVYVPEVLRELALVRLAFLDHGDHDSAAKLLAAYEAMRDAWNDDPLAVAP